MLWVAMATVTILVKVIMNVQHGMTDCNTSSALNQKEKKYVLCMYFKSVSGIPDSSSGDDNNTPQCGC